MIELNEKDYLHIKEEAHRLFITMPVATTNKDKGLATERYFLAMCYTKAVIGFLKSRGLLNETNKADSKENRSSKAED